MKIRNLFELMGFRGRAKRYGYDMVQSTLSDGRIVRFARWQHPNEPERQFEDAQIAAFEPYVSPGDFCIDIGAHSGDSTLPIALAVGPQGCVLALEPNPFLYHVLEKNARANRGITNIRTMMAAATPQQCFSQFEYSDPGYCNGGRHQGISALRHGHAFKLDVFGVNLANELQSDFADLLPRLRLIKVDAEGFDLYVLESLREIIASWRPVIKAEIFKKTDDVYRRRMFELMSALDYQVYLNQAEPLGRGPLLDGRDLMSGRHFDILCLPAERVAAFSQAA